MVVTGAFLGVFALEAAGVVPPTWSIDGNAIVSRSRMLVFDPATAPAFLIIAHLLFIFVAGWFGRALSLQRRLAIHRAERQAWHLKQLLP
jgi:hypothetical protein